MVCCERALFVCNPAKTSLHWNLFNWILHLWRLQCSLVSMSCGKSGLCSLRSKSQTSMNNINGWWKAKQKKIIIYWSGNFNNKMSMCLKWSCIHPFPIQFQQVCVVRVCRSLERVTLWTSCQFMVHIHSQTSFAITHTHTHLFFVQRACHGNLWFPWHARFGTVARKAQGQHANSTHKRPSPGFKLKAFWRWGGSTDYCTFHNVRHISPLKKNDIYEWIVKPLGMRNLINPLQRRNAFGESLPWVERWWRH